MKKYYIESKKKGMFYVQSKSRKTKLIGHFWRRYCLLRHPIEIKIEGRFEEAARRGRRRKQLMYDVKETKGYCKLKDKTLDRILWRTSFGRGCGPVVRQTSE
jgi:hypothetical protein